MYLPSRRQSLGMWWWNPHWKSKLVRIAGFLKGFPFPILLPFIWALVNFHRASVCINTQFSKLRKRADHLVSKLKFLFKNRQHMQKNICISYLKTTTWEVTILVECLFSLPHRLPPIHPPSYCVGFGGNRSVAFVQFYNLSVFS